MYTLFMKRIKSIAMRRQRINIRDIAIEENFIHRKYDKTLYQRNSKIHFLNILDLSFTKCDRFYRQMQRYCYRLVEILYSSSCDSFAPESDYVIVFLVFPFSAMRLFKDIRTPREKQFPLSACIAVDHLELPPFTRKLIV